MTHNMPDVPVLPSQTIRVLTEADVLEDLRKVLSHGHGHLHVVVQDGYIHSIAPTPTRLGKKPVTV